MLARNFKTANELKLCDIEHAALVETLYRMENGDIKPELICMNSWTGHHECGTTHCIAGWAHAIDARAFPEVGARVLFLEYSKMLFRLPIELLDLFGIESAMRCATPAQATAALRTYLETGRCPRI